jgi:hypothetical protein
MTKKYLQGNSYRPPPRNVITQVRKSTDTPWFNQPSTFSFQTGGQPLSSIIHSRIDLELRKVQNMGQLGSRWYAGSIGGFFCELNESQLSLKLKQRIKISDKITAHVPGHVTIQFDPTPKAAATHRQ